MRNIPSPLIVMLIYYINFWTVIFCEKLEEF